MSEASSMIELLGQAYDQFNTSRPILFTYTHLILSALLPIFAGSHASLSRPSSAAKPKKKKSKAADDDDDDDDEEDDIKPKMEGLEPSDALMFPLIAGLTLGGLYLVIKWLEDPAILNKILSFYFSQMGLFFAAAFLTDGLKVSRSFIFPSRYTSRGYEWKIEQSQTLFISHEEGNQSTSQSGVQRKSPLPGLIGAIPLPAAICSFLWTFRGVLYQKLRLRARILSLINIKTRFGILDTIGAAIALAAVAYFAFFAKPWWLTNLLGFSFCYGSLQFMSPSTFLTGTLILVSLFLYDIYFVFFTPLMVTVATKLDVPIKLLIPRPSDPMADPNEISLAMLGLGDIVVPGMMIGLALRFDLYLYYKYKGLKKPESADCEQNDTKPIYQTATGGWGERFWTKSKPTQLSLLQPPYPDAQAFPKPYFYASLIGYIVGMIATLLVMQYSNHAQPALLYLVPGVLISLWGTAFYRGELPFMLEFSDMSEDAEVDSKTEKDKDNEKGKSDNKRGLFARIWAGDVKAPFDISETRKGQEGESKKETSKTTSGDETSMGNSSKGVSKKTDELDERCLFSLSISLPKKAPDLQKLCEGSVHKDSSKKKL
ncbi:putative signal peptide peptidase [Talaromyces proteolyticus]|uniref:Signal peptide peptidase n=1 Tax=Talaromyces proteolyticus TaxID=1131652 RepID=A0AAD4KMR6_9EURO|nr:putative signal peptide peptidase [Talaromyces proteolyticus]KAH8695049.1 putative signal peptide peptidase [Talaromyces proteolyticus]